MGNNPGISTARLTAISGYLSSPSDRIDLDPPIDLRPGAEVYWTAYVAARQPHEWTPSNLQMLKRLSNLCQLYAGEFDKMVEEGAVAHRASGAPFTNPRYGICQDLLNKIGTLEAFMGLNARSDSAAARTARLVNVTTSSDEDGLL